MGGQGLIENQQGICMSENYQVQRLGENNTAALAFCQFEE